MIRCLVFRQNTQMSLNSGNIFDSDVNFESVCPYKVGYLEGTFT